MNLPRLSYRTDIDGLRAIAVMAVLGFHVMPWRIPGGFIGVDVFFVISGFLITRIIWRNLEAGTFSIKRFYSKRILRLFPVLFTVLLTCACIVYLTGLPDEVRSFGMSAIAATFYVSNHYFLSSNNYFDESLEISPLLHTWSLSVEEQFYIIFPVLLLLLFAHKRHRAVHLLVFIGIVSFALSEALIHINNSASFFIAPSRFWQFIAGAVIALNPLKQVRPAAAMEAISWLGMGAITFSFFYFSGETPFPGAWALIPTLGTAMLIYAGQQEGLVMSRFLSLPVARFFGKISYSLYLWHWPIIVFYKLLLEPEPSSNARYGLILCSILAGYLSWRFIENPIRNLTFQRQTRVTLAMGTMSSLLICLISYSFVVSDGGKDRFSEERLAYIEYLDYDADQHYRTGTCFLTNGAGKDGAFNEDECIDFNPGKRNVLLVGDSHSAHYYAALKKHLPSVSFSQVSASGCRPLTSYEGEARCVELMRQAFEHYATTYTFDAIIIAGRWESRDLAAMQGTLSTLSNVVNKVIVLGPIIEHRQALPRLLTRYAKNEDISKSPLFYGRTKDVDVQLAQLVSQQDAEYYSVLDIICPDATCKIFSSNGAPIQFDASHLTFDGAMDMVQWLMDAGMLQNIIDTDCQLAGKALCHQTRVALGTR